MPGERNLSKLLEDLHPTLHQTTFVWCTLPGDAARPAGLAPVVEVRESEGTTLVLPQAQADGASLAWTFRCRMITLEVHSSLEAVGLLARVATALAERGIPANAVAGYYHDHLFVPADRVDDALETLEAFTSP